MEKGARAPNKHAERTKKINAFLSIDTKFMYITCTEAALFDYTIFPI